MPAIPRRQVHELAEACAEAGADFQRTATRLLREQRRLVHFLESQVGPLDRTTVETCLYMTAVCLRVFEGVGGRMRKVTSRELDAAAARVQAAVDALLPVDEGFPARARQQERAQPYLLDEVLWAIYERPPEEDEPGPPEPRQQALTYLTMWTVVEALDAAWRPPRGYQGETRPYEEAAGPDLAPPGWEPPAPAEGREE